MKRTLLSLLLIMLLGTAIEARAFRGLGCHALTTTRHLTSQHRPPGIGDWTSAVLSAILCGGLTGFTVCNMIFHPERFGFEEDYVQEIAEDLKRRRCEANNKD